MESISIQGQIQMGSNICQNTHPEINVQKGLPTTNTITNIEEQITENESSPGKSPDTSAATVKTEKPSPKNHNATSDKRKPRSINSEADEANRMTLKILRKLKLGILRSVKLENMHPNPAKADVGSNEEFVKKRREESPQDNFNAFDRILSDTNEEIVKDAEAGKNISVVISNPI